MRPDEDKIVLGVQHAMRVDEAPMRGRRMPNALVKREQDDRAFFDWPAQLIEHTTPARDWI